MGEVKEANPRSDEQIMKDEDMNFILDVVAHETGTLKEEMLSTSRRRDVTDSRFIAYVLMREFLSYTIEEIGMIFGRHHSTVVHALNRHGEIVQIESAYRRKYDTCRGVILTRGVTKEQHIHKYRTMSMKQIIGGLPKLVEEIAAAVADLERRLSKIEKFLTEYDLRWPKEKNT